MTRFVRILLLCATIAGVVALGGLVASISPSIATAGCPAANPNCGY